MSIVAEQYTHVIGVDTHARTHTYVVVDTVTGRVTAEETFPTSPPGLRRAITWMNRVCPGTRLAAVEGTNTYASLLCAALRDAEIPLTEVHPPTRTERRHGKSDAIDAEAAARAVLRVELDRLIVPREGKTRSALRIVLAAHHNIERHRSADRYALTALVRTVNLGVDARRPLRMGQIRSIAGWRAHPTDDLEQRIARAEATRLARSFLHSSEEFYANELQLRDLVATVAWTLLERVGVGPISAAIFLTAWSHPGRVRSEAAFASLAGAAPIPASSGNTVRYRLSRQGDRQLNRALDIVARARLLCDPPTQAYAAKAEPKERPAPRSAASSSATSPARSTASSPQSSPSLRQSAIKREGVA